jgi:hypothetical protein
MTLTTFSMRETAELTLVLRNTRPVDVTDFANSLQALGREYEEFVAGRFEPGPINAHLYVSRVESGSIFVTLEALLDQASFIVKHIEVFAGFIANIQDIMNFLLKQDTATAPKGMTNASVERVSNLVEPVANDSGSNLTINVNVSGNTGPVNVQPVVVTSEKANAIQNGVRRYLGQRLPANGSFKKELLHLQQMRGDPKAKTGDRGIIEKFSSKPVKLHFMTPQVKSMIVDQQDNPFKMAYVVDGEVSTVNDEPALYKIYEVHEAIEKP